MLPGGIPACAANLLARPEWFRNPGIAGRARLEWINDPVNERPTLFPGMKQIAKLLSSRRFSGRDDIWAITLGSTIFIRMADQYAPHTPAGLALLAHELKHVEQFEREGTLRFLWMYVAGYRAGGGYGQFIPFETEAYTFADKVCEHLRREFAANPGVSPCLELADAHTPNANFMKIQPLV